MKTTHNYSKNYSLTTHVFGCGFGLSTSSVLAAGCSAAALSLSLSLSFWLSLSFSLTVPCWSINIQSNNNTNIINHQPIILIPTPTQHSHPPIHTLTHLHTNTHTLTHTHTDDECLLFSSSGRRAAWHGQRAIPGQERQGDQADHSADPRGTFARHIGWVRDKYRVYLWTQGLRLEGSLLSTFTLLKVLMGLFNQYQYWHDKVVTFVLFWKACNSQQQMLENTWITSLFIAWWDCSLKNIILDLSK